MATGLTQIFNLLQKGYLAKDILGAVTKLKPDLSDKVGQLMKYGYGAEVILKALTDKSNKTTPSMFRSEFGDYLRNVNEQSAKDYDKLIKTITTAGVASKAVSNLFSKYGTPSLEMGDQGAEVPQEEPSAAPQQQVQQPVAPPEGLIPSQERVASIPSAQPSAEQMQAPEMRMPSTGMGQAEQPSLFSSRQYQQNPVFGDTIVKAVKQNFSKKQIMELVNKAFRKQAADFEQETGKSIEDEIDTLMKSKRDVVDSILYKKSQMPLVDAGVKPKLSLSKKKPSASLLEQMIQPSTELPKGVTPNVDKQAFLMQMEELKKLLR